MQGHIAEMKEIEQQRDLKKKRANDKARRQQELLDPEKSSVHKRQTTDEIELSDV
jgi:hypothetical protein